MYDLVLLVRSNPDASFRGLSPEIAHFRTGVDDTAAPSGSGDWYIKRAKYVLKSYAVFLPLSPCNSADTGFLQTPRPSTRCSIYSEVILWPLCRR